MNVPTLISYHDFFRYSPAIIGDEAARLGKLADSQLPIAPIICITRETLLEIAQYNKIDTLLHTYTQTAHRPDDKKQLYYSFIHQSIPEHIAEKLLEWHHTTIGDAFSKVFASHTHGLNCHIERSHISGNTNMIQSLLEVWWEALVPVLDHQHTVHTLLSYVPTAICVQKESRVVASGIVYSVQPVTGSKTSLLLEAVHGVYQPLMAPTADTYEIDSTTWDVSITQNGEQTEIIQQESDELMTRPLSKYTATRAPISEKQAKYLAELTVRAKKKYLHQIILYWVLTSSQLEITSVEPYYFDHQQLRRVTKTKVFITAGNPYKANEYKDLEHDGIFFKSDYVFMSQGIHPTHLLKSSHLSHMLGDHLLTALTVMNKHSKHNLLIYRPLHAHSKYLASLSHSEVYEPKEENPLLGFTGALKAIHMPDIFSFELKIIKQALPSLTTHLSLQLPYIRSSAEIKHLLAMINRHELMTDNKFSLILPISSPGQLFSLDEYTHASITSYSVDLEMLGALMYGYDPENKEVAGHYRWTDSLLTKIFELLQNFMAIYNKKVYIYLNEYSRTYIDFALQYGLTGVIIKPKNLLHAKESIIDFEKQHIDT